MKSSGADTSKLSIKYYKENKRGVIANQDIKAGEDILFVPKSLMITYNDIAKTKIGDQLIEKIENTLVKTVGIAAYIMMARQKSKETPCVELFPNNFQEQPDSFTDDEMECLMGCDIETKIEQDKEAL